MLLHRLPNELIQNIAFLVVAHVPLGPPSSLLPLLTVSKRIYAALLSPSSALKARIFRLKFDSSAVSRRSFSPYDLHLADQLEYYCRLLRVVKSKDVYHEHIVDYLFAVYVMMLDNDGKNFAQLECAGIAEFADKFIRLRLWQGRMENGNAGWPLASVANRCALWIAWLTMDRFILFKEPHRTRDEFTILIFPYTLLSPRYPSTVAPPNHFHLPLLPQSPSYQPPLSSSSHPNFPPYPHYAPHPTVALPYFGSIQSISPPLISIAAKLLFTARKEIFPINIPHTLPPGLRPEDYAEFNKGKAAEVPRGARWDWDRGAAVAVNSKRLRNAFRPNTKEAFSEFEQTVRNEVELIADGDEESRRWDEEWWRRILCDDLKSIRPNFAPGLVYKPGTLRGTWQGRLYTPLAEALHAALETYPDYPGYPVNEDTPANVFPAFSEASTTLVMIPVFFNIDEHHRICHCPSYLRDTGVHQKGCGMIPVPLPSLYPPRYMRWRGMRPHMVVVPPEEGEVEVQAGEPEVPEDVAQAAAAAEPTDEPTANTQVPLVFGFPSNEAWPGEENPANPALNGTLTVDVEVGNPNTDAYAYASVAPVSPLMPNHAANTANTQAGVQTAAGPHIVAHTGTHGQGQAIPTAPVPAVQQDLQPQPGTPAETPDLITFLTQRLEIERQTNPRLPRLVPTPVDYSMNNAYFPGDVVPSLMSVKRRTVSGVGNLSLYGGKRRDEIVFGFRELGMGRLAGQAGEVEWKMADGRCVTTKGENGSAGGKEASGLKGRQLYVYETYDPEKESAHDPLVCLTCKEWEDVRRNEKKRREESCERKLERRVEREEERRRRKGKMASDENATVGMLEAYMQDYGRRAGIAADGVSRSSSMEFETLDTRFGKELSDAVAAVAAKSAAVGPSRASTSATASTPVSGAASEPPSESDYESGSSFSEDGLPSYDSEADDPHSQPRRRPQPNNKAHVRRSRGDDLPHGQPAVFDPHSQAQAHVPPTRRVFDRTRVGAPEGCSGVRDIVITGETPRRHVVWHRQMYRLYGRVRSWDGMIGLLRVDERSMPGYTSGLGHLAGEDLEESEYWSVITNMFICGYIVGGRTFVGEWRMAANDPLKPGWSGPILMSLREQVEGEDPVWEPVGGKAL